MPYGQSLSNLVAGRQGDALGGIFGGGGGGGYIPPGGTGWADVLLGGIQALPQILAATRWNVGGAGGISYESAPSLPPGSTGQLPALPGGGGGGGALVAGMAPASGLYHTTACGYTAPNPVVFQTAPTKNGGTAIYAGMVKRISMAKLRRSIMAQVRTSSSTRRRYATKTVTRYRSRPRRRC